MALAQPQQCSHSPGTGLGGAVSLHSLSRMAGPVAPLLFLWAASSLLQGRDGWGLAREEPRPVGCSHWPAPFLLASRTPHHRPGACGWWVLMHLPHSSVSPLAGLPAGCRGHLTPLPPAVPALPTLPVCLNSAGDWGVFVGCRARTLHHRLCMGGPSVRGPHAVPTGQSEWEAGLCPHSHVCGCGCGKHIAGMHV